MKNPPVKNVAASVLERLYQFAAHRNEDFALILTRYALDGCFIGSVSVSIATG